jgi:outer membrane protein W
MKLMKVLALVAIVALAVPLANAADSKHKISLFTGYAMPMGDETYTDEIEGTVYEGKDEADDAMGFGLGYEYRMNKMMSFGASLSTWTHDVNSTYKDETGETLFDGKFGEASWMPLLFDANFHLFGGSAIDFYLGPTVGYAMFDDFEPVSDLDMDPVPLNDQFTYGVNVGLDVNIGENWAISGGLRYLLLDAEPDAPDSSSLPINPIIVTVGVGYKF